MLVRVHDNCGQSAGIGTLLFHCTVISVMLVELERWQLIRKTPGEHGSFLIIHIDRGKVRKLVDPMTTKTERGDISYQTPDPP